VRDEPSYADIWNQMSAPDANEYKLMVMRVAPQESRGFKIGGYLKTFHLPTTIPDIIEKIGSEYGGGKFQIRIVDGAGKYVKSKTFEIAGMPKCSYSKTPTTTKYMYSIPNFPVNIAKLAAEVSASSILSALDRVDTSGDTIDLWFKDTLSTANKATLDSLINAHEVTDAKAEEIKRLKTQLAHKNSLLEIKDQLILNKDRLILNKDRVVKHTPRVNRVKKGQDMKEFLENSHDDIDDIDLRFDSRGQLESRDEDAEAISDWSNFAMRLHTTETLAVAKKDVEIARAHERVSMYRYELYATVARWIATAITFSAMTYFITP